MHDDCRLRKMTEADLSLVLTWRNSDRVRPMMYSDHVISSEEHRAWFARVSDRDDCHHRVFEYDGRPVGVVNVSQIELLHGRCHWGFYLGEENLPKGCGITMGVLALDFIFSDLRLHKVVGEVLASNSASLKYHHRLGFVDEGRLFDHVKKNGRYEDVLTLAHFADQWRLVRPRVSAGSVAGVAA
jgi:UDP-4-amino-4,6-dideoxy-N-acetyl-beta-L-altrosamine N-acetyltransferase